MADNSSEHVVEALVGFSHAERWERLQGFPSLAMAEAHIVRCAAHRQSLGITPRRYRIVRSDGFVAEVRP